jgi:hypothetical protein
VRELRELRELVERLLGRPSAGLDDPAEVERLLRERFRFLEERQGFELAGSSRLEDGAVAAYANRPARRGVAVFARRSRGVWAGVGTLADDGHVPPVNRETVGRGVWREVRRVDLEGERSLDDAVAQVAALLGGSRD